MYYDCKGKKYILYQFSSFLNPVFYTLLSKEKTCIIESNALFSLILVKFFFS
ncbi:hypothetical protein Hanom_Chr13g01241851 [Helianthus anomalus]